MLLKGQLSSIDFYKSVPKNLAEGTASGAMITLLALGAAGYLIFSNVMAYSRATVHSELIVDEKHMGDKLDVWLDIEFPDQPCTFLSLDLENNVGMHINNITMSRYVMRDGYEAGSYQFGYPGLEGNIKEYERAVKAGEGCRVKGRFELDRVPGNFHISSHPYMEELRSMNMRGTLKAFNYRHVIHRLHVFREQEGNELDEYLSAGVSVPVNSLGLHYLYYLNIVQEDRVDTAGQHSENYRIRMHHSEENLAMVPMVMFRYSLSPVNHVFVAEFMSAYELLVRVFSILGGVFTVARLLDLLVHRSLVYLLEKDRMGKLR